MSVAADRPAGWGSITPRLITPDVAGTIAFLRAVFAAEGDHRPGRPAELRIGDSIVMVSDGGGLRDPSAAFLHVYVVDADETYRRALEAGATSMEAPEDMPYGDRRAMVKDPWGNLWQVATYRLS